MSGSFLALEMRNKKDREKKEERKEGINKHWLNLMYLKGRSLDSEQERT